MQCPRCKCEKVDVLQAVNVSWNEIYRLRRCVDCGHKFFTAEMEVECNPRFKKEWALYSFKAGKNYNKVPKKGRSK